MAPSVQLPPGHSPDDLIAALDARARTTLSQPSAVVVGGHPAMRVDLTGPRRAGPGECLFWETRPSAPGTNPLVIVDVAGTTVVIDLQADPTDDEIARMIESITFTGP